MKIPDAIDILVGLEFDDATAANVGTRLFGASLESRRLGDVGVDPYPVLVGLGRVVVPKPIAFQIAVGRCQGRKASLACGLPVHELNVLPLLGVHCLVITVEHDIAGLVQLRQRGVGHGSPLA